MPLCSTFKTLETGEHLRNIYINILVVSSASWSWGEGTHLLFLVFSLSYSILWHCYHVRRWGTQTLTSTPFYTWGAASHSHHIKTFPVSIWWDNSVCHPRLRCQELHGGKVRGAGSGDRKWCWSGDKVAVVTGSDADREMRWQWWPEVTLVWRGGGSGTGNDADL